MRPSLRSNTGTIAFGSEIKLLPTLEDQKVGKYTRMYEDLITSGKRGSNQFK